MVKKYSLYKCLKFFWTLGCFLTFKVFFWKADETMEENEIESTTDDEMYEQTNFDTFIDEETLEQTYYYSSNDDDGSDGEHENFGELSINGENHFGSTTMQEDRFKQKMGNRTSKEKVQRQKNSKCETLK